jgi:hypothetical protein
LSEENIQLWLGLCLVGGFCAHSWYWWIRSIILYRRNGFDFTKDFGPKIYHGDSVDDDRWLVNPRDKLLFSLPLFVVVSSVLSTVMILGLLGVLD